MRELFAVVPLVAEFARIQLFMMTKTVSITKGVDLVWDRLHPGFV